MGNDHALLDGTTTIGIIGCGQFGRGLAQALLNAGLPVTSLVVSYGGSPATAAKLRAMGLAGQIRTSQEILEGADLVIVAVRPVDVGGLGLAPTPQRGVIASAVAGLPRAGLDAAIGARTHRFMASSPDSLVDGSGIATAYPSHPGLTALIDALGLASAEVSNEEEFEWFTMGVCLSVALLLEPDAAVADAAVAQLASEQPIMAELYPWALAAPPAGMTPQERDAYIANASSEGGVTDVIAKALRAGESFMEAMRLGRERLREIGAKQTGVVG